MPHAPVGWPPRGPGSCQRREVVKASGIVPGDRKDAPFVAMPFAPFVASCS